MSGGLPGRRAAVAATPGTEGVDRVRAWSVDERTVRLEVEFVRPAGGGHAVPSGMGPGDLRIAGDPPLRVQRAWKSGPHTLRVVARADEPLDLSLRSTWTLQVQPRPDVDPRLREARFVLGERAAGTPRDAAAPAAAAAAAPRAGPVRIDYLTKDYATFRRLMLDRLAVTLPQWTERNPSDVGVMLVEALAYAADHLSYHQDAAATEAYLGTARLRRSLRRHARLLDYAVGEGCAAAAWVQLRVRQPLGVPAGTRVITRTGTDEVVLLPGSDALRVALERGPAVFETVDALHADPARNELPVYAWDDPECVLPPGTTRATLQGRAGTDPATLLRRGDVLVLAQRTDPRGGPGDPTMRRAVRLTAVRPAADPLDPAAALVEVEWDAADAPPFPLYVTGWDARGRPFRDAAVALGNVVLADHGRSVPWHDGGPDFDGDDGFGGDGVDGGDPWRGWEPLPAVGYAPYRPALARPWVTRLPRMDPARLRALPAAAATARDPAAALPAVQLRDGEGRAWTVEEDLLGSGPFSRSFVVEPGEDGAATLRFGDGRLGMRPAPGTRFHVRYRVGYGPDGNVGAGALACVVAPGDPAQAARWIAAVDDVDNPLPAVGGAPPEPDRVVRASAPEAFHRQARCIVPADWAQVAPRVPGVRRAAAVLAWTGSWRTAFVHVQRVEGLPEDAAFLDEVRAALEPCRPAGQDLRVLPPDYLPLRVDVRVRLDGGTPAAAVERGIRAALTGPAGLFARARQGFGEPVWQSRILAAVSAVRGVAWAEVAGLSPLAAPADAAPPFLPVGPTRIARLDDDPEHPAHGQLFVEIIP